MRMTKLLGDRCHAVAMWYAPSYNILSEIWADQLDAPKE